MKRKTYHSFIKSHNLVNRIYDMLDYLDFFEDKIQNVEKLKKNIFFNLNSIFYVETLAKYFEDKKKYTKKNIELRINLSDLINDLDYLKQYLVKKDLT